MGLGDCKACEAYKEEIKHLRALVDRTMDIIAPKNVDKQEASGAVSRIIEDDIIKLGEG